MHRRSVLSSFYFFIFFSKKYKILRKIDEKGEARKITKNDHQGVPRIAKNAIKPTLENLKNQKKWRKTSFFEGAVFSSFFKCVFRWILGLLGVPGGRQKSTFSICFSTFLRACRFRAAPGVSWDRFGSIFHRFSVDFGTIFGPFLLAFLSLCCRSVAHLGPILDRLFLIEHRPCGKKL